jgi:hypothetical protein
MESICLPKDFLMQQAGYFPVKHIKHHRRKTAAMRLNRKTVNCQQNRNDAAAQISNRNISNFH